MTETLSLTDYIRLQAARRSLESAKARYVQARVAEAAAAQVGSLIRDRLALIRAVERMQAALDFHDWKVARVRARFERELPRLSGGRALQRPTFLDRLVTLGSSDRLYREWRVWGGCREEVASDLAHCRESVSMLSKKIEAVVQARTAAIERRLATPAGFREALSHDRQLALAYGRLSTALNQTDQLLQ